MSSRRATLVADLGFGDAGKGTIVDFLSRQSSPVTIVRYNGGSQAAHNVITPDGIHHTFSQFGSGTFVPGTRTHLSRFTLINPVSLTAEAEHLRSCGLGNVFSRLTVDEDALVVTPFMEAANRLREVLRGDGRHGSCGKGIGETTAHSLAHPDDAVRARDLRDPSTLLAKLQRQQDTKHQEFREHFDVLFRDGLVKYDAVLLNDTSAPRVWTSTLIQHAQSFPIIEGNYLRKLAAQSDLIFEGAQGVLIDEWHGFHPYTTWSTTTFANALQLLNEIGYAEPVERLGILRTYFVRHGPGPFPTEDGELTTILPDAENTTGKWQGAFRVGYFDAVLANYAIAVCGGIDALALTHLDRFPVLGQPNICTSYRTAAGIIGELRPKPILTDLGYQEEMTELLSAAQPVYAKTSMDAGDYTDAIESILGTPVTITSNGPRASDKQFHSSNISRVTV